MKLISIIKRAAAISALLAVLFLSACSGTLNAEFQDGLLVVLKTRTAYTAASLTYLPTIIGDEYAVCREPSLKLHKIGSFDTKLWLTSESAGRATTLFYNSSEVTLPTWDTLNCHTLYVCSVGEKIVAYDVISDASVISKLVEAFLTAESAPWRSSGFEREYDLLFAPDNYPMLYMALMYGESKSGAYIYERSTKRCVEIGDLLSSHISAD